MIFSLALLVSLGVAQSVWAAPIACTGSSSGKAGTCSTISNCSSGTTEVPASSGSGTGGPSTTVCPEGWMCCITPDTTDPVGTKPPKTPPVILPPADPGTCAVGATCKSSCGSNETSQGACTGGVCCVANVGNNPGNDGSCVTPMGQQGTCSTSSVCSVSGGQDGGVSNCTIQGDICCVPQSQIPPGGSGGGGSCAGGNGTCSTLANCGGAQLPSNGECSSGLVCCTGTSSPTPGTGTTTGTVTCPDPTNYESVAGVCFPKNTGLSNKSVLDIIAALIGWLLAIFGFIALLGFIISGLQYLTAAGDEGQAETAKRNMQYSIIGIIVALSGWIIIKAVDALLNANSWI